MEDHRLQPFLGALLPPGPKGETVYKKKVSRHFECLVEFETGERALRCFVLSFLAERKDIASGQPS